MGPSSPPPFPGAGRDYIHHAATCGIVRTLIAERKKREIDPTLSKLREPELGACRLTITARPHSSELGELIGE